jgi:hypothetical protein
MNIISKNNKYVLQESHLYTLFSTNNNYTFLIMQIANIITLITSFMHEFRNYTKQILYNYVQS